MHNVFKKPAVAAALVLFSAYSASDAPQLPPVAWKVCNRSVTVCAAMHPKTGATVFKVDSNFVATEAYKIEGWHNQVFVSDDGQFFVSGYRGLNLVPIDVKPSQVMLTVWKNGAKHLEVSLGPIVRDFSLLRPTASHYFWGTVSGLSGAVLSLNTVAGPVAINIETGVVSKQ